MKRALFVLMLNVLLFAGASGAMSLPAARVRQSAAPAPSTFGIPVLVSVASSPANPRLALSSRGDGIAVFTDIEVGTGASRVYARRLIDGAWQTSAQPIAWLPFLTVYRYPDVALSSDGNGAAVFLSGASPASLAVYANLLVGGVWQSPTTIDWGVGNVAALPPHVALSSDGNGFAVFTAGQDTYAAPLVGGVWQMPYRLSGNAPLNGAYATVALAADGDGLAAYNGSSRFARQLVGGVWRPPEALNCGSGFPYEAQISLAFEGTGLMAYNGCDNLANVAVLKDHAFQLAPQFQFPHLAPRVYPHVASAPGGTGVTLYDKGDGHIYTRELAAGGWGGELVLDTDLPSYTGHVNPALAHPDLGLTYAGNGAAVFYKQDNAGVGYLFAKRRQHGVWQGSELLASASSGLTMTVSDQTQVALVADGSAVALFESGGRVYATSYFAPPAPALRARPHGLSFPTTHVGLPSDFQSVTLTNVGSAPLTITGAHMTGSAPGDFTFASNQVGSTLTGTVLAPGASTMVNITFAPAVTGTRSAALSIFDNAFDSPQSVPVSGFAAGAPAISIAEDAVCQGMPVVVHGRNFPNDPAHNIGSVSVYVDANLVASTHTDSAGNFLAQFTAPPLAGGQHTLSASDAILPGPLDVITTRTPITGLPVIFIPGVSGSNLDANTAFNYLAPPDPGLSSGSLSAGLPEPHSYSAGERIWLGSIGTHSALAGLWRYFDVLRLDKNGFTPLPDMNGVSPDLRVNGTLFSVPSAVKTTNIYGGFRTFLLNHGLVEGQTLFYFPYDWRKDIGPTAADLDALVDQALAASGQSKVVLIAHSMGGVVARNYLLHFGAAKVEQLVTLGTPYLGAPKVYKVLELGDDWDIGWYPSFGIGIGMHPNQIKKMAQNYISTYELLPSGEWFNSRIDPAPYNFPDPSYIVRSTLNNGSLTLDPLDFSASEAFIAAGHNADLLKIAEGFHAQAIGDFTKPTDFYFNQRIIGAGVPTLGHLNFTPRQATAQTCLTPLGPCWTIVVPLPEVAIPSADADGDGTVPWHSAVGANRSPGDYRFYYVPNVKHMDLVSDANAQFLVSEILNGRMCSNSQNPFTTSPVPSLSNTAVSVAASAVSTRTLAAGTQITLIGDAELNVYDALGQHAGPISPTLPGSESNIPGVDYEVTDGAATAMITASGTYTIVVRGNRTDGAAMVRVSALSNGAFTQSVAYEGIPITSTTVANLTLTAPGLPVIPTFVTHYDVGWPVTPVNNLGLLSGPASLDLLPPKTSDSLGANRMVTLSAQDEPGGSGVARVYFSTETPPVHYTTYTGPFALPAGAVVTAFALDHAGNAEYPPVHVPRIIYLPLVHR